MLTSGAASTATATGATARFDGYSLAVPLTACVIVVEFSDLPATVNVCGVFQSVAVNDSDAGDTVAMPAAPLVAETVTVAVGCEVSCTV